MCAFTWNSLKFHNSRTDHAKETKLHQLASLTESKKALEAHGCKSWITKLLIVILYIRHLTANITYCTALLTVQYYLLYNIT